MSKEKYAQSECATLIVHPINYYNGSRTKLRRLGLQGIFREMVNRLEMLDVRLEEQKDANGSKFLRQMIDEQFEAMGGWIKTTTGNVDWVKEKILGEETTVKLGVELQVSARSDLVIRDLLHFRKNMIAGELEVMTLIVPSDKLSKFLVDRAPSLSETLKYVEDEFKEIQEFPLVVMALEHDGSGKALPKQFRKS